MVDGAFSYRQACALFLLHESLMVEDVYNLVTGKLWPWPGTSQPWRMTFRRWPPITIVGSFSASHYVIHLAVRGVA